MITAIEIQNFKGIGDRVRVELRPITLFFGPNSAGKSTVLHAIHYAREVLERRNLNADRFAAGGPHVDLGGFESFVFGHILSKRVHLKFDLDLSEIPLKEYRLGREDRVRAGLTATTTPWTRMGDAPDLPESIDYSSKVYSATVELSVAWSEFHASCYVESYQIGINGEDIATITCDFNRRRSWISKINTQHPVFPSWPDDGETDGSSDESVAGYWLREAHGEENLEKQPIYLEMQSDALPRWGHVLGLLLKRVEFPEASEGGASTTGSHIPTSEASYLIGSLTQLLVGPGEVLREELSKFRYLGPLREIPSRTHSSPRTDDPSRWSVGLAAWDLLQGGHPDFIRSVSEWLNEKNHLDAGYAIELKTYREIDDFGPLYEMILVDSDPIDLADLRFEFEEIPVKRRLVLIDQKRRVEVLPYDVGVGIAQLIPVVVLALEDKTEFAAIEQPELHVHPRIQVGLGDLFIWGITERPTARFLIETHSEHLLLRLLRRIRETSGGELKSGTFPGLEPGQVSVVYVENAGGQTRFLPMRIDETGEFIDRWPHGFFEERAEELF